MTAQEDTARLKLVAVITHPIQYYTPVFQELARRADLTVVYARGLDGAAQADIGFEGSVRWDIDLTAGHNHAYLPAPEKTGDRLAFFDENYAFLNAVLRDVVPDAALIVGWYRKPLIQALVAAKRRGVPAIVRGDSHLNTPRPALVRAIKGPATRAIVRRFDAALYTGTWSRDYFAAYGMPADRLFHAPHCVDAERFAAGATDAARARTRAEIGATPDERLVLLVARLIDLKRPLDVVEAAARLAAQGRPVRAVFAGPGPLEDAVRARAAALGVPAALLGFVNQSALPGVYAAADVVVLASDRETWGLTCNEALACGRPIVVSEAAGCAPDLAADGTAGRTFPPGDVAALADALDAVLSAPPGAAAIRAKSDAHSVAAAATGILDGAAFAARRRPGRRGRTHTPAAPEEARPA